jgi:hypothetical protein
MVRSPKNRPNKAKHCKNCSKTRHLKAECWLKYLELKPQLKESLNKGKSSILFGATKEYNVL